MGMRQMWRHGEFDRTSIEETLLSTQMQCLCKQLNELLRQLQVQPGNPCAEGAFAGDAWRYSLPNSFSFDEIFSDSTHLLFAWSGGRESSSCTLDKMPPVLT